MGNEQSTSAVPSQAPNSTFSFLSGKGANTKRSKGIVIVSENAKVEKPEDDEVYKRFQEIPRFLPILRHAIGKKDVPVSEMQHRMSSRPLFRMATRFQHHLKLCANAISSDQVHINNGIKNLEASTVAVTSLIEKRKKALDEFSAELDGLEKFREDVFHIQLVLENIVPMIETMNELLVPSERLPPLALSRVLERTPESTSASSSQLSTPKHVLPSGSNSSIRSLQSREKSSIAPIEEVRVVDRKK